MTRRGSSTRDPSVLGEFSVIEDIFAPLTEGCSGALALGDDVAVLDREGLVFTKDMLISGVHFRKEDLLDLVAKKLLRVNISDLVAKGVRPEGYLLGCAWHRDATHADISQFARGLADDQQAYKCTLFGGDTTRQKLASAPLVLSATFFGRKPDDGIITRSGASKGDDIYVTGTIGDAGLGLACLEKKQKSMIAGVNTPGRDYLVQRYHLPEPRVTFGTALKSFASAAMDVSDGVIGDASHLARQSGVKLTLDISQLPLSEAATLWLEHQKNPDTARLSLAGYGDDYEILFTAPASLRRSVEMAAKASRTRVSRIGSVSRGYGVIIVNAEGTPLEVPRAGYDHFDS